MAIGLILVDGQWQDYTEDLDKTQGQFIRHDSVFRNWIQADPNAEFPAQPGRYHLYISLACPWAHRALIFLKLKKLENLISYSIVNPIMGEKSWHFSSDNEDCSDPLNGFQFLFENYLLSEPNYTGYVTVPVLWDKETNKIVNNESSEIVRMLNSAFDAYTDVKTDYYPKILRAEIDSINSEIYKNINNGVYRCGFAKTQTAYESAFDALFSLLDKLEQRLSSQRYLCGASVTEADWRLFTTLVRFDAVYFGHFKTNLKRIIDYTNLWNYLKDLYQLEGISETVNMVHIKNHYYRSHQEINPTGIVPKGPELNFLQPHDRDRF